MCLLNQHESRPSYRLESVLRVKDKVRPREVQTSDPSSRSSQSMERQDTKEMMTMIILQNVSSPYMKILAYILGIPVSVAMHWIYSYALIKEIRLGLGKKIELGAKNGQRGYCEWQSWHRDICIATLGKEQGNWEPPSGERGVEMFIRKARKRYVREIIAVSAKAKWSCVPEGMSRYTSSQLGFVILQAILNKREMDVRSQ